MLNIPTLLPNEIDKSYLGAVMRANGVDKEADIVNKMALYTGLVGKSRREVSCLKLLSKVAQTEVVTFVRQHTTLPLRRGITSYYPELLHGAEDNRSMLWTTGMRVARPGAYCCPTCIEHDLATYGRSYWHREHQLPGLLWCPSHGTSLCYMENEKALLLAPNQKFDECLVVTEPWLNNTIDNRYIKNFLAISYGLLAREKPFSVKHVSAILKKAALVRGFHAHCGKVKAPLLSDAITKSFGREWLATVMPTLADKLEGEMLSQMDGVLFLATAASSTSAYILALAFLFETPEDALSALTRSEDGTAITGMRARSARRMDSHELLSAYLRAQGSYTKAAQLLEASYSAVCGRLRNIKLPNLSSENWHSMQKAATAFAFEDKSLPDSASTGNLATAILESFVRATWTILADDILEQKKPKTGRGSGVRRPQKLAPNEVTLANGLMATKYSPNLRPEQRPSLFAA